MAIKVKILGDAPRAPITRFRPHPMNDNRESGFMFGKLLATLRSEGFAQPIIVRSGNEKGRFPDGILEIIGGEHRWKAMEKLGQPEVSYHDLGCVSDLAAKKLLINLNKIQGESDQDRLSALIRSLNADGGEEALESIALDEDTLHDLLDDDAGAVGSDDAHGGNRDPLEDDHGGEIVSKASPRDLLAILDLSGMSKRDLDRFLEAVRQWSFGRADTGVPAWQDLETLLRASTSPAE